MMRMDIRAGLVALLVLGAAFALGYWCGKIDQRNVYLPMLRQARADRIRAERRAMMGRRTP
jgi:hypothetical protein